jgi:hypothetical protein
MRATLNLDLWYKLCSVTATTGSCWVDASPYVGMKAVHLEIH